MRKLMRTEGMYFGGPYRQRGATLVEVMVGLALSLIVTGSMIALMGNSMGTATRIIQMSQLTDELRNTMSIMSRDVRRANYNANALYCFANAECGEIGNDSALQAGDIVYAGFGDGSTVDGACFRFGLDRDWDGNASNDGGGAFRGVVENNVGRIEMWVGDSGQPTCDQGNNWVAITDPDKINVTHFLVEEAGESYGTDLVLEDDSTMTQRVRFVNLEVGGELNLDDRINRMVVDRIKIRNDFYAVN